MPFHTLYTLLLEVWHTPIQAQSISSTDFASMALFPRQNDLRNTLNLSGIWQFRKDSLEAGVKENWQNGRNETHSGGVNYKGVFTRDRKLPRFSCVHSGRIKRNPANSFFSPSKPSGCVSLPPDFLPISIQ
ncbi:hypothetical protein [Spirosoma endbachense]|uniref:Uncharacterized protein n=1 Tax=Spirosoma endbachense TaxID=2666025 RepID=A0A6P1VX69_9BACT|nr:hypothetical protein [Spirosoma endbachense]QHV96978.1 hypothetical protein GJR95_19065 [Spirosoma endbachense]